MTGRRTADEIAKIYPDGVEELQMDGSQDVSAPGGLGLGQRMQGGAPPPPQPVVPPLPPAPPGLMPALPVLPDALPVHPAGPPVRPGALPEHPAALAEHLATAAAVQPAREGGAFYSETPQLLVEAPVEEARKGATAAQMRVKTALRYPVIILSMIVCTCMRVFVCSCWFISMP